MKWLLWPVKFTLAAAAASTSSVLQLIGADLPEKRRRGEQSMFSSGEGISRESRRRREDWNYLAGCSFNV